MFQNSNKIIAGLCIFLLSLILEDAFGEEHLLDVNVTSDYDIVFRGDEFWYDMRISNNGNESIHNVTIKMNMTGPGKISPNQGLNCLPEKTNLIFCKSEISILPGKFIDRSFAIEVDSDAPFDAEFSTHFEVTAESNSKPNGVHAEDKILKPNLPKWSQAFVSAGISEGNGLPPIPGQSFSMFILAKNDGPTIAESVELHFRIWGPAVISKIDLPSNCFVYEDPRKVICIEKIIPSGIFVVKEIPILVDFNAKNGENFRIDAWVWTGSKNDPIQEFDSVSWEGLQVISSDPIDVKTELQNRINEQQRIKSLQELEDLLFLNLKILNDRESAFRYISSTSDDKSKIIIAQKEYLEAKMNYLQIFQQYINKKPSPTVDELKNLSNLVVELKLEYEKFTYENLFNLVHPKVEKPIKEDFSFFPKPKQMEVKENTRLVGLSESLKLSPKEAEKYAQSHGLKFKEGKTQIIVELESLDQKKILQEIGANIETSEGKIFQVEIPVSNLEDLTKIEFVKKLRPPANALQTGTEKLISEGVEIITADLVQKGGFTGKDVKVAVLDLGFDLKNPEISNNIKGATSFRYESGKVLDLKGTDSESDHGTAVAEIIVDVAPDVDLHLYSVSTETEFANAVDHAIKEKIDLIVMSLVWIDFPTNGNSTISKKVEQAISEGIPFVVSSGNYAQMHWEGKFKDDNQNSWHDFFEKDEGYSINVESVDLGFVKIQANLLWYSHDDSKYNFDLVLIHDKREVAKSSDQSEELGDFSETLYWKPTKSGVYSLAVVYRGEGLPDATLEIFTPDFISEYSNSTGSVAVPTDSEGVIVAGAVKGTLENLSIEPYSSQGPTNNGRSVPTVVAPSGVETTALKVFTGTSASAPYVAGIIALMLEKDPNYTPSKIKNILETNADKKSVSLDKIRDDSLGYGKADSSFLLKEPIPDWIKDNALLWAQDKISENEFVRGIQFLITERIIIIPPDVQSETNKSQQIPEWIKNNAAWWAEEQIDDDDFIKGIQYLVEREIIQL